MTRYRKRKAETETYYGSKYIDAAIINHSMSVLPWTTERKNKNEITTHFKAINKVIYSAHSLIKI